MMTKLNLRKSSNSYPYISWTYQTHQFKATNHIIYL